MSSCCDISKSILLRVRTLVRNFIWRGDPDKRVRARVAWDTAIIPTIKGGLKIFDPYAQAWALLAKMLVRGMVPGPEPWKSLIRHRITQLQLRREGDWGMHEGWLFAAPKVKPQGSPLWKAIWAAWTSVKPGASKTKAQSRDEQLRQQLFLNPEIIGPNGQALGWKKNTKFRNWSVKGINAVKDVWNAEEDTFIDIATIRNRTRSHNAGELHTKVTDALQHWNLTGVSEFKVGDWVICEDPPVPGVIFFLRRRDEDHWDADPFYFRNETEELRPGEDRTDLPFDCVLSEARVVMRAAAGGVTCFNPKGGVVSGFTMWAYRSGRITDLQMDPKEWTWDRQGLMKRTHFFDYSCRRGYRIIIKNQHRQFGFDQWMEGTGYNYGQRKSFFAKLWHTWLPRKVSSMIWLTIADGLPIGAWRRRCIGQASLCTLCPCGEVQTAEHAFFTCASVTEAWDRLRHIFRKGGRFFRITTWANALYGDIGHPLPPGRRCNTQEDHLWDVGKECRISLETPFHILRCTLIWYIWCQHTKYDLHSGVLHIGIALFRSWQTTVQVGMAAWKELQRYRKKRTSEKHSAMEDLFLKI